MIENVFATPIYKSDDLYDFSVEERKVLDDIDMHPNNGGNFTTTNKKMLNQHQFSKLKIWCKKHLYRFCNELGVDDKCQVYITQSWFNINRKFTKHHTHYHPNSLISAILYVHGTSNQGEGQPTIFYRDTNTVFGNLTAFKEGNTYNSQKVAIKFEIGRLILFPSTLLHEVSTTEIDTPRVSMSFNTFFKGDIGTEADLTKLVI